MKIKLKVIDEDNEYFDFRIMSKKIFSIYVYKDYIISYKLVRKYIRQVLMGICDKALSNKIEDSVLIKRYKA